MDGQLQLAHAMEEEDDYKAAGYRKLQQLKLLKAAAARLILQDGQGSQLSSQLSLSSSSFSSTQPNSLLPLVRSISNIEHVLPAQQRQALSLSRTSSTDRPTPAYGSRGDLPPLMRSNSMGANSRLAAFGPAPQVLAQQQASTRPAAFAGYEPAAASQPAWPRVARHSEPVGCTGPDDRVELLLAEVESLLAERQKMSARLAGLQRDNDTLAELVGRLAQTLQEQELQLQQLQKQQQHIQQQQQQQQQQHHSQHSGSGLGSVMSLSLPAALGQQHISLESPHAAAALQQQQHHAQQQHQQQQQLLARQVRLDAWLGRRQETWQEWQERLPLEHMHSGSSSSLTVALEQQ